MQRRRPIGSHRQWCLGAPPAHAELGAPFAVSRDGIARGREGVVFSAVLALVARGSSAASAVLARSWSSVCSR